MESGTKRIKVSEDSKTHQTTNLLNTLCNNFLIHKIAVEYHDDNFIKIITYKEIETTKTEIEEILSNVTGSQFIAIDLEIKDFCIPSLVLGILSSGRGFVNISPSIFQDMCSRLKVKYLFTQNSLPGTEKIHQMNLHGQNINLLKIKNTPDDDESKFQKSRFAYAISTSGTTGVPKIVKVPHDSIVFNILDLRDIFSINNTDKIAQLTALTFDPSIVEIFLGLCSNCTLFMASRSLKNNPRKLLEIMDLEKVTMIQTTPSLLFGKFSRKDVRSRILGERSNLKILVLGGEPFPKLEALETIRHDKNQTRIFSIYGITEVSCWASIEEFKGEKIADICNGFLGKPLSETFFQVKNEENKIIEEGEGTLLIGSEKRICLIDNEEINLPTTPVFRNTGDKVVIDNRRRIFYRGRHNKVVKRYGNKVDLGKLENCVLKMKLVENCCAIWNESDKKLHVCVSTVSNFQGEDNKITKLDIMNYLQNLPSIYRPDEIHLINNFPLTVHGKICFQTLKEICTENTNFPSQNLETTFRNLWKLYAGSFENGFIKSGGDSVAALQIVNSLSDKFDQEFPELIRLLLNDADFSNCLNYVKNRIEETKLGLESGPNSESKVEIFASSSRDAVSIKKKEEKEKIIRLDKQLNNICIWQKCRGFKSGDDKIENETIVSLKRNVQFQFLKSFDLKKCVDASPTIFQYSSGKVFATVGSHSGIIITVEINSNSDEEYIVELPDRIEASVLVFDNFRGVVGCYDGNVYCLNLKTGEIFWKFQTGDSVKSSASTCPEKKNIFVGSYDRHMYCLSLETGFELWKMRPSEGSISGTARLHSESKSLLFGTLDGTCVNLDQVSGNIKWRYSFSDPIFSAPAILETGNVIFASVSGNLACFNIQSGHKLWTYSISGNIFSHLVAVKSTDSIPESILIASRNKILYNLECDLKPSLKFSTTTENPIIATPWNTGKMILIACINGNLQIINSDSGEIVNSYKLSGEVFSSPVMYQELIAVGCRDNKLYILKLVT